MNRFRAKKKGGKEEAAPRPSQDSDSVTGFNPFRKSKKAPEAEKPDLDLSAALPSNDDFRTSLLMSGLSARFSMLREQDDPSSKIGKASDDSVLYPRRQSRLDFSNMRDLGDISEVDSIQVPPSFGRGDSYYSGGDTDSITGSSIMGRAKPTEGNNLFGGRQKIYKIPVGADSSRTVGGGSGMGGRALYDDDVAQSAFQRWRQAEKGRKSPSQDDDGSVGGLSADEGDQRDESPYLNSWNRKRETSSTTSSIPSMPRNSTAATSVASSQPASSVKDWQSSGPHSSVSSAPGLDKSASRSRRLYETGLSNDLHEHQTSALSRIDTLTRQRTLGSRTPESRNSPSPTMAAFLERSTSDRKLLAKASAPNLRSMSPPASASTTGPADQGFRAPSAGDSRVNSPLSPPVSESEDTSFMAIGPNDRGKATALGLFQKPAQTYDESRYAERQIQLNQGRDTPVTGQRPGSKNSDDARSRSSSASRQQTVAPISVPALPTEETGSSFLIGEESEDAGSPVEPSRSSLGAPRPSDNEHPAFRAPIPLSVVTQPADEPAQNSELPAPKGPSGDSPTLGPTSGLSGMVRQHLRGDSNASSIYGGEPLTADLDGHFPQDTNNSHDLHRLTADSNPYAKADPNQDWDLDFDAAEPIAEPVEAPQVEETPQQVEEAKAVTSPTSPSDEFASRLADGARRVRERLTSYVESDSRSTSPYPMSEHPDLHEPQPPLPPPTGLGIVRPKGSFGSLADRGRDPSSSKAMKMLGLGSRGQSPTSGARNEPLSSPYENTREVERAAHPTHPQDGERESRHGPAAADPGAGLRAFRQARRDNRRMKEQETVGRRQHAKQSPPSSSDAPHHPHGFNDFAEHPQMRTRNPNIPRDNSNHGSHQTRAPSSSDRDRSGSDSSNGGRSANGSHRALHSPFHESFSRDASPQGRGPGMRPPMGPEYRRSPAMPPHGYPRQSPRAAHPDDYPVRPRGMESGHPSPLSTNHSPMMGSGPHTPNSGVVSPNRAAPPYPPGSSPNGSRNQSRSNSRSGYHAPPVPPINPRRRPEDVQPKPMPPGVSSRVAEARNAFAANDEDERRLRKGNDLPNFSQRPSGQALPINLGPPASRSVVTQSLSRPNSGLPGGMI